MSIRDKIVEALDPFFPNPEAQMTLVVDALVAAVSAHHDARVTELLVANNVEVEKRRSGLRASRLLLAAVEDAELLLKVLGDLSITPNQRIVHSQVLVNIADAKLEAARAGIERASHQDLRA